MRHNHQDIFYANQRDFSHRLYVGILWKRLPFYPGKGDALDEVSLSDEEYDDHGQQCND
jgi:hypothetical protein